MAEDTDGDHPGLKTANVGFTTGDALIEYLCCEQRTVLAGQFAYAQ